VARAALVIAIFVAVGVICVRVISFAVRVVFAVVETIFDVPAFDGGDMVHIIGIDFGQFAKATAHIFAMVVILDPVEGTFAIVALVILDSTQRGLFFRRSRLFGEQGFAILFRDLVVIWVNFAECEETVPVPAKIYESGLKRGFDPRDLCQIDIAFDLLVIGRFKVEFLNTIAFEHRNPGFFRVARIDEHTRCHLNISRRARAGLSCCGRRAIVHGFRRCGLSAGRMGSCLPQRECAGFSGAQYFQPLPLRSW